MNPRSAPRPPSPDPPAPAVPVDAVYLWVDGADPALRESLARHRALGDAVATDDAAGAHRFRDSGELRFSLRSLELNAPWIRHIHLVTNGQVPDWLNLDHPRISLVTHAAIYPDASHLPTFNSHSIELHLHRIPGLSERFLYLNDDVFFGRPVALEDFTTPSGGQRILLEPWHMPTAGTATLVHDRAYVHTQRLLDEKFGVRERRNAICHAPQLYDSSIVRGLQETWPDEVARTSSHRFRAPDDVALRVLYFYSLLEEPGGSGRHEVVTGAELAGRYRLARMRPGDGAAWALDQIARERPAFFCINDELEEDDGSQAVRMRMVAFLYWYFRQPSTMERPADWVRRAAPG